MELKKIVSWIKKRKININHCIVGEPTNLIIYRRYDKNRQKRKSFYLKIKVTGKTGQQAYPHLAHNPMLYTSKICNDLCSLDFNKKQKTFLFLI